MQTLPYYLRKSRRRFSDVTPGRKLTDGRAIPSLGCPIFGRDLKRRSGTPKHSSTPTLKQVCPAPVSVLCCGGQFSSYSAIEWYVLPLYRRAHPEPSSCVRALTGKTFSTPAVGKSPAAKPVHVCQCMRLWLYARMGFDNAYIEICIICRHRQGHMDAHSYISAVSREKAVSSETASCQEYVIWRLNEAKV